MSIKDVTQSILAILVVAAALYSAIMGLAGSELLLPVAGVVIGYYFKDAVSALGKAIKADKE